MPSPHHALRKAIACEPDQGIPSPTPQASKWMLEQLEPRMLLSADPLSAALGDAASWLPELSSAEHAESQSDALRELTSAAINPDLRADMKVDGDASQRVAAFTLDSLASTLTGSTSAVVNNSAASTPIADAISKTVSATQAFDLDALATANSSAANSDVRALIFIDAGTPNYQQLIDDLQQRNDAALDYVLLDKERNGIEQISAALARYDDLDAVHIVSHGDDAAVQLGDTLLSRDNLAQYTDAISGWQDALSEQADLLFYGCNLAASTDGQALVQELASLSGADVAASTDLTGHAALGGDWELEFNAGAIETSAAFSQQAQQQWSSLLAGSWFNSSGSPIGGPTDGANIFVGDGTDDTGITGGDGSDVLYGAGGADNLAGENGEDRLFGGDGDDTLDGGNNRDILFGGAGNDLLEGDNGQDILIGGGGNDILNGGNSGDLFLFSGAQNGDVYTVDGGNGADTLDISAFVSANVVGSTITVQMGSGESFTINHSNVETIVEPGDPGNKAADADAGPDQTAATGALVTLDASGSSDPDGDTLTYSWQQISGPFVTLSDTAAASPTFIAPGSLAVLEFAVVVSDATTSDVDIVLIDVNTTNAAPVLADAAPVLADINEDDFTSAGDSVASIVVDGSITDADGAPVESIAITAADDTNGTWQFSTDNGGSWSNVDDGSLAVDHALLLDGTLSGGATQKLRFVPDANFNGSATFTFRAWDMSNGVAASYSDTSAAGATTPYSAATDTAVITVTAITDLTAADDAGSTNEDTVISGDVSGNDSTTSGGTLTYAKTSDPGNGAVTVNPNGTYTYTPDANFNGTDSFTYTVTDADSGEALTQTVTITVNPVVDLTAADDADSTSEDTILNGNVSGNDSTTSGGTLTYAKATDPANGAVSVNANGSYTYTPDANFNGNDSFTYTVTDADSGEMLTRTVNITVNAVADLTAINDTDSTNEDTVLNGDVSGNDSTTSGGTLTYAKATDPANGTVTVNANGTYTYTPGANFNGTDGFTYTVTDADSGEILTRTVTITVNAVVDLTATNDTDSIDEDTTLNGDVSGNDSTTSGGTLTYAKTTDPSNGTVTVNANGTYTYTPDANFNGSDSFTYTVTDADSGETLIRAVNITVNAVVDLTATNDTDSTNEDTVLNGDVSGNDSTTSGGTLTYAKTTDPGNGTVTVNANGTYAYTPDANFNGADSFTYTVTDTGSGETLTRTVNITINATTDLTAADDADSTGANIVLNGDVSGNDSTTSGGTLTYAKASDPTNGAVTVNANGTYTYTPDTDFTGNDSFTYTVTDASAGEAQTRTVNLTVNPTRALWLSATEDNPTSDTNLPDWYDNDVVQIGPGATFGESTSSGAFQKAFEFLRTDGSDADIKAIHYISSNITVGSGGNTFDLQAGDVIATVENGLDLSSTNTLSVTENDVFVFRPDTPGNYSQGVFSMLLDDAFGQRVNALTLVEQATTLGGHALNPGDFLVAHEGTFADDNVFKFVASGVGAGAATAGAETLLLNGFLVGVGLGNEIDGLDIAEINTVIGDTTVNAGSLLLSFSSNSFFGGNFTGVNPQDVVVLNVTDTQAGGGSAVTPATILLDGDGTLNLDDATENLDALTLAQAEALNDLSAGNDADNTNEDVILNGDVSGNDSTTSGGTLSFAKATDPTNGAVTVNANGTYTYTPDLNFNGADSFTYTVTDANSGENATRTVNLTINGVADLTATDDSNATADNVAVSGDVSLNDSTTSGGVLTFSINNDATNGTVSDDGNGAYTYTPNVAFTGTDSFTYTVTDASAGEGATRTVTISVNPINSAPTAVITPAGYAVNENTALVLQGTGLSVADSDAGSADVLATLSVGQGALSIDAGGTGVTLGGTSSNVTLSGTVAEINDLLAGNSGATISYQAVDAPSTATTLTLTVDDLGNTGFGGPEVDTDTATLTIAAENDAPTADTGSAIRIVAASAPLQLHGTGLVVGDPDAGSASIIAQISVGEGMLAINAGSSGVIVSGNGSASATLVGSVTQINTLLAGNAGATLLYQAIASPAASTTLTLAVSDAGNSGSGGALTASDQATLLITPPTATGSGTDPDPEPAPEPEPEPEPAPEPEEESGSEPTPNGDSNVATQSEATRAVQATSSLASASPAFDVSLAEIESTTSVTTESDLSSRDKQAQVQLLSVRGNQDLLLQLIAQTSDSVLSPSDTSFDALPIAQTQASLLEALDNLQQENETRSETDQLLVASTVSVSTGLSVGYVAWLLRGGVLLSTLLSSLPAWRVLDPLPVLGRMDDEEDDDDLSALVEGDATEANPPADAGTARSVNDGDPR